MQRPEPTTEQEVEAATVPSVAFCITELDPGGAEKALVRFAKGIHNVGWTVRVVSLRDAGALSEELEAAGIDVTALNCGGFGDVRAIPRLARLLRRVQPDMLVCFLHQANIVGRIAGWLAGVQQVISGVRVADRRRIVVWTDWLTQRLTCHYTAVSQHVASIHSQLCGITESRFTVLYNGVEIPDSRSTREERDDSYFRILFAGRLTSQKRPLDLVQAVSRLPEEILQRTMVDILGDGDLERPLRNAIEEKGLEDRIRLHGYQANMEPWWAQADVLVLPSAWEGLPNVVLEAMAHHVPVIASRVDGVREVIEDGKNGWLVKSGNVQDLVSAIIAAESSPEVRNEIAQCGFDSVRQRFCWQKSIEAFINCLAELRADHIGVEKR